MKRMKMKFNPIAFLFFLSFLSFLSSSVIAQEANEKQEDSWSAEDLPFELEGFVHSRHGVRIKDDPFHSKKFTLSETRWRLGIGNYNDVFEWNIKTDFIYDSFDNKAKIELREANLDFDTPAWIGLKIGRQILTWGKGDMLFINDLFPKDWQSFFIGRELEYLKAPSDALKLSFYFAKLEINLIYTPSFDNDIFPTGERLSFFDSSISGFRGNANSFDFDIPNDFFKQDEFAWRLRRNIGSSDLALYGYYGYWKSPSGIDLATGIPEFNKMISHGMSFESKLLKGIFSIEMAYYYSSEDSEGSDFAIANSNFRYILGQNFDLKNGWNLAFQYYSEVTTQYDNQINNWPAGFPAPGRVRDMITIRVGKNLLNQRMNVSLFNYYGRAEKDNYLRVNISYKIKDDWKIDFGSNVFSGEEDYSFWNQFNHNNNLYIGLKWSY